MEFIKNENEFCMNYYLKNDNKFIHITYGGNLDLYWSFHRRYDELDNKLNYFVISKENIDIYNLFNSLFIDVENINVYNDEDKFFGSGDYEESRIKYIKNIRRYNHGNYNELYNPSLKKITWYSDEASHRVANYLEIFKKKEYFIIFFNKQKHIRGYDEDFGSSNYIPIRFRNSGSYYDPFNLIFMRMYYKMKDIDVNHQISIEEYDYQKRRSLLKK